jgi:phage host-nuclease inhibitor protein Gam
MTTTEVMIAEQQLAAAKAAAAKETREDAKRKIEVLRREGASLRKQLEPMSKQIKDAQNARLRLHRALLHAREQIDMYGQPLDPLTLPTDEEIAEHDNQLGLWKREQKKLLAQHADVVERESIRPQAIAMQKRLQTLQLEIQNWIAVAEGRKPGQLPEGGVFRVGEDFLGHSDRRFS